MSIDGKSILERVKARIAPNKVRRTYTIDPDVVAEFERKAGKGNASECVEEMMKDFNATAPEPRKGKK